jgi:purine-nucleoside phosphorylase
MSRLQPFEENVVELKGAKIIDFTGKVAGAQHFDNFSDQVTKAIRSHEGTKIAVVIDAGFGFETEAPHLVSDHINLTGTNPLLGPNDTCGERFPVVNDIYVTHFVPGKILPAIQQGVLGGLKQGFAPSADEIKRLKTLGAEFFSYNLAQTMIVAAHSGWKVLGIVLPSRLPVDGALMNEVKSLVN